mgnify:CR=1 FL=1
MRIETMLTLDGDDAHLRRLLSDLSGLVRVAEMAPQSPAARSWRRISGNAFSPEDVAHVLAAAGETAAAMRETAHAPCPLPPAPDDGARVAATWAEGLRASADLIDRHREAIRHDFETEAPGLLKA